MLLEVSTEEVLDKIVKRVERGVEDEKDIKLYKDMYANYLDGGVFDDITDFAVIERYVDDDCINNCMILDKPNDKEKDYDGFNEISQLYEKQGLGDISIESDNYSYIEAVDNNTQPSKILVRAN